MKTLISCAYNMDNCCVEVKFSDGSMIAIDTIAVENEIADNTIMKKLYGIKSPVSQHPKKPLLSCCGSSPTSKTRCRTRTASVRLWIFGRTRTAVRSLLRGQSIWTGSSSD